MSSGSSSVTSAGMARHMAQPACAAARGGEAGGARLDPGEPGRHSLAGARRDGEDLQAGIDPQRIRHAGGDVELEMRQQVALVQQHEVGGGEHVGILQRLVLAFGDRQHHHLVRLAEVEGGRADQVADILDEQQAARRGGELVERMADHVGVEMAALAGVDLHGGGRRWRGCARHRRWSAGRPRSPRWRGAAPAPRWCAPAARSCPSRGWRRG